MNFDVKRFIATYLIPAYFAEYVSPEMRDDFLKIVDTAEDNMVDMERED